MSLLSLHMHSVLSALLTSTRAHIALTSARSYLRASGILFFITLRAVVTDCVGHSLREFLFPGRSRLAGVLMRDGTFYVAAMLGARPCYGKLACLLI